MNNISLIKPKMFGNEEKYVKEAFDSNWLAPLGPFVDRFEKDVCEYLGCHYAVATCSGTSAIHLAFKVAGIKRGDIVFCPDFTFIATINPVLYEGGIPVFIDCDAKTGCMDPVALENAFKKYNAKYVIVTHINGCIADMDEIKKICKKYNAILIEDGCEAFGSLYKDRHANTFADFGCLSFNGNKVITTTGGGMLICNKGVYYREVAFSYATQSRVRGDYYIHDKVGYNYRLSNVCAAIGVGQLENIENILRAKKYINDCYKKGFRDNHEIEVFDYEKDRVNNHWLSCIKIKNYKDYSPEMIFNKLKENHIESRFFWVPMHTMPMFTDNDYIKRCSSSNSEKLFKSCLCLPSDLNMSTDDLDYVIDTINKVVR